MTREPLDFDDAGAQDDEPAKGVTVGDIRAWHDEVEQTAADMRECNQQAADNFKRAKLAEAEIERLKTAIRITASEGTYDETAIRKAVSFELAELIVEARAAFELKS